MTQYISGLRALVLLAACCCASSAMAQFTDTTPPNLVSATFNPNPVDAISSDASVTLTLHVTDDLSGINFQSGLGGSIELAGPSGQRIYLYTWTFVRTDANPGNLDTEWQRTFTVYKGTENGDWQVSWFSIYDQAGNGLFPGPTISIDPLTISSVSDLTPPAVSEPAFLTDAGPDVNTIDCSTNGQWIALNVRVVDDNSGFGLDDGTLIDPYPVNISAVNDLNGTVCYGGFSRMSGTRYDGVWQAYFWFPQYSPTGTWTIHLDLTDNAFNRGSYDSSTLLDLNGMPSVINVVSDPADMNPPGVSQVTLSPITIDTSAADATVSGSAEISDNLSGVNFVLLYLRSPSGSQWRYLWCYPPAGPDQVSGTVTGSVVFPRYSEAGTWKLAYVYSSDYVNNITWIPDPQAAGLSATLNVILPSLSSDGSVGPAGGTISDPVFTNRASITIPPGVAAPDTQVAIDVLATPLDVPLPSGYAAANTFYVNIHLDPEPAYPLGPPGLTVVLPLRNPLTPGTMLDLFRINPATGQLEPSLDFRGLPVQGTVDPGGLSATFIGVSRLSTVVALVPNPVITWANPAAITYGTPLSATQLNATSSAPGHFEYSPVAGTVLNAGLGQVLTAVFVPDDPLNYSRMTNTVVIDVLQAPLKIKADNKSKVAGQANPTLTVSFDGFVNGDTPASLSAQPVPATPATAASPPGTYDITVSGAAASNYEITYVKGTLNVLPPLSFQSVTYPLVSSKRISSTVWEYTYQFRLMNSSLLTAYNVTAKLNPVPSQVTVVDGEVSFGTINAGQTVIGTDTFKVRIDRTKPVQDSDLSWTVTYAYDAGGALTYSVPVTWKPAPSGAKAAPMVMKSKPGPAS